MPAGRDWPELVAFQQVRESCRCNLDAADTQPARRVVDRVVIVPHDILCVRRQRRIAYEYRLAFELVCRHVAHLALRDRRRHLQQLVIGNRPDRSRGPVKIQVALVAAGVEPNQPFDQASVARSHRPVFASIDRVEDFLCSRRICQHRPPSGGHRSFDVRGRTERLQRRGRRRSALPKTDKMMIGGQRMDLERHRRQGRPS